MSKRVRFFILLIGVLLTIAISLAFIGEVVRVVYPMSRCKVIFSHSSLVWFDSTQVSLRWGSQSLKSSFILVVNLPENNEPPQFFVLPTQELPPPQFFVLSTEEPPWRNSWHTASKQTFYTDRYGQFIYKFDLALQEEFIVEDSPAPSVWHNKQSFDNPVPSPSGEKLAYFIANNLFVKNISNSWWTQPQRITNVPLYPLVSDSINWHPNEPWIVYSSSSPDYADPHHSYAYSQIFLADIETKEEKLLTNIESCAFTPQWSPDGELVAYITARSYDVDSVADIFIISPSTQTTTNVTNTPLRNETDISWSPDGRKILFTGYFMDEETYNREYPLSLIVREYDLFIVDVATKEQTQLTYTPHINEFQPVWSEDGQRIAFLSEAADADRNNPVWALEILDLETMTRTTLGEISDECVQQGNCFSTP